MGEHRHGPRHGWLVGDERYRAERRQEPRRGHGEQTHAGGASTHGNTCPERPIGVSVAGRARLRVRTGNDLPAYRFHAVISSWSTVAIDTQTRYGTWAKAIQR
jgi:hypothetical protein